METLWSLLPSSLLGLGLGVVIGKLWAKLSLAREQADNAVDTAITSSREHAHLCGEVLDFVTRARRGHGVADRDWHDLVDQTIHEGTPEAIRQLIHQQCGTHLVGLDQERR